MSDLTAFFYMGGYAAYVWPALIITFIVLLANVLVSRAQYKRVLRETAMRAKARAESKSN